MKVGIGYSNTEDSTLSGKEVAKQALKNGSLEKPGLAIAFCNSAVNHNLFMNGLQEVLGDDVPIIGGSAIGIITNKDISYEGQPAGAMLIQSETVKHRIAVSKNLDKGEKKAGNTIAETLGYNEDDTLMLLFYDSIKKPPTDTAPPFLNASSPLITGIEEKLESEVPIIGAGLMGDFEFGRSKQFCGSYVSSQSAVGVMLSGKHELYNRIMHGCTPLDGVYHTITNIEGSVIYEIDNKPVIDIIDNIYENRNWRNQHPVNLLSIGVNCGEKYGKPRESDYINRLITGPMPDGKGIGLFEPDLEKGTEIQFMLRDTGEMIKSVKHNSEDIIKQIVSEGSKPVFGLYINCAGRAANQSNTSSEEASEVQKVCNHHNIPLLGFYSGVEIAPMMGKSRGLDWTAVFMVVAERA
ncbi:hypothetical protein ES708_11901 [subsurface metagenome]